jgi:hypothetical protein
MKTSSKHLKYQKVFLLPGHFNKPNYNGGRKVEYNEDGFDAGNVNISSIVGGCCK